MLAPLSWDGVQDSLRLLQQMELVNLPDDQRLVRVEREWYAKGFIYACQDVRRELLILSQRVTYLQQAIEQLCNQTPSMTSLFENASRMQKSGRTGAWSVVKLLPCQISEFVDENRVKYKRVVMACDNWRKWRLAPIAAAAQIAEECELES